MTIVRVGSTGKYAEGWDKAFGRGRGTTGTAKKKPAKKAVAAKKPSPKKSAPKKASQKKSGRKSY